MASPAPSSKRQKRDQYLQATQTSGGTALPKKKFYRQRAHANPFSDHQLTYPANPALMDWSPYFPAYIVPPSAPTPALSVTTTQTPGGNAARIPPLLKPVTVADIGCGFGGLLVALSRLLPDELILGLEIRTQVQAYASSRIHALRAQHLPPSPTPPTTTSSPSSQRPSPYQNISALRSNTMKFLPNLFSRSQLSRLFLCFPDPHFKARKHKARIVSRTLVAEYAFVMQPGGVVYLVTDVRDLFEWVRACFGGMAYQRGGARGKEQGGELTTREDDGGDEGVADGATGGRERELWEEVSPAERERDPCLRAALAETEEGRKVERNRGEKFVACWRRRPDPEWPVAGDVEGI